MPKIKRQSKNAIRDLEHKHSVVLSKADQLYEALNNIRYEGKVSLGRNIKQVQEVLNFFNNELVPHIELDEEIVFPFLRTHIPRLEPMLNFLRAEHKEMRENFKSLDRLLREVMKKSRDDARQKRIEKLRDKGIYLVCLMRNHIQAESDNVYRSIDEELKKQEKEQLFSKYEYTQAI